MTQRTYSSFQFFFSLLIWTPVFFEVQKRAGLTNSEIFQIQSLYYLVFCLIEIPTGWFADRQGHRTCLVLSAAILAIANLIVIPLPNYWGFLLHWMGVGLSRSFVSGAANALLYNDLEANGRLSEYARIEGRSRAISLIGKLIAWAAAGWMIQVHWSIPYILTAASATIALRFALIFPKSPRKESRPAPWKALQSDLIQVLSPFIHRRHFNLNLWFALIHGIFLFVVGRLLTVNLYQPVLSAVAIPVALHGLIMSAITGAEALGSENTQRWTTRFSDKNALGLLTLGCSLALGLVALENKWATLGSLFFFSMVFGVGYPLQKKIFIQNLPHPHLKATYLSLESIIDRLACSAALYFAGMALNSKTLNHFFAACAGTGIFTWMILHFFSKRRTSCK